MLKSATFLLYLSFKTKTNKQISMQNLLRLQPMTGRQNGAGSERVSKVRVGTVRGG